MSSGADKAEITSVAILDGTAPAVLNISGSTRTEPRVRRKKQEGKSIEIPATPTINPNTFPGILSKIMLKCDEASPKPTNDCQQYVAVLYLINQKTNKRIYHMFCTQEKDITKDYDRVKKLYENKSGVQIQNQYTIPTICARALYRSIQEDLKECKHTREGMVYETTLADSDDWEFSQKLRKLNKLELEKLINYIKFLSIYKQ